MPNENQQNSTSENSTSTQPRWLNIAKNLILPVILAVISTAGFSELILNFFSIQFQSKPNWVAATYQPSGNSGNFDIFYDNWKLKTSKGRVNAVIKKDDDEGDNNWIAQGYLHNGIISMSYAADKIENKGAGVFYLARTKNDNEYRGHQLNYDCDALETLACPYILIPIDAKGILKDPEHQAYLRKGCTKVNSPPPENVCKATK